MNTFHRLCIGLVFLLAFLGSAASFVAQYVFHFNPCPMCIFQRVAVMVVAVLCLPFLWKNISSVWIGRVVSVLIALPALFGLGVAIQQISLQALPPNLVPACGPGLDFLIDTLPLSEVVSTVLSGSGECATIERFLGVSLAKWNALLMGFILLILFVSLFARNKALNPKAG